MVIIKSSLFHFAHSRHIKVPLSTCFASVPKYVERPLNKINKVVRHTTHNFLGSQRKRGKPSRDHSSLLVSLCTIIAVAVALGLLRFNVISPTFPTIRCKANATNDPDISHKYKGDTVTNSVIASISLLLPLFEVCN